jgi:hypothetical protein
LIRVLDNIPKWLVAFVCLNIFMFGSELRAQLKVFEIGHGGSELMIYSEAADRVYDLSIQTLYEDKLEIISCYKPIDIKPGFSIYSLTLGGSDTVLLDEQEAVATYELLKRNLSPKESANIYLTFKTNSEFKSIEYMKDSGRVDFISTSFSSDSVVLNKPNSVDSLKLWIYGSVNDTIEFTAKRMALERKSLDSISVHFFDLRKKISIPKKENVLKSSADEELEEVKSNFYFKEGNVFYSWNSEPNSFGRSDFNQFHTIGGSLTSVLGNKVPIKVNVSAFVYRNFSLNDLINSPYNQFTVSVDVNAVQEINPTNDLSVPPNDSLLTRDQMIRSDSLNWEIDRLQSSIDNPKVSSSLGSRLRSKMEIAKLKKAKRSIDASLFERPVQNFPSTFNKVNNERSITNRLNNQEKRSKFLSLNSVEALSIGNVSPIAIDDYLMPQRYFGISGIQKITNSYAVYGMCAKKLPNLFFNDSNKSYLNELGMVYDGNRMRSTIVVGVYSYSLNDSLYMENVEKAKGYENNFSLRSINEIDLNKFMTVSYSQFFNLNSRGEKRQKLNDLVNKYAVNISKSTYGLELSFTRIMDVSNSPSGYYVFPGRSNCLGLVARKSLFQNKLYLESGILRVVQPALIESDQENKTLNFQFVLRSNFNKAPNFDISYKPFTSQNTLSSADFGQFVSTTTRSSILQGSITDSRVVKNHFLHSSVQLIRMTNAVSLDLLDSSSNFSSEVLVYNSFFMASNEKRRTKLQANLNKNDQSENLNISADYSRKALKVLWVGGKAGYKMDFDSHNFLRVSSTVEGRLPSGISLNASCGVMLSNNLKPAPIINLGAGFFFVNK